MADLNAVIQFIVKMQSGRGYDGMAAGSGWFTEHDGNLVIMTNAHVVNGTKAVFIRLPADHNVNIRAFPVGISSDLDLAICKLDADGERKVKEILKSKYDEFKDVKVEDVKIPTLVMADSDSVHPSNFTKLGVPRVIARGYPHGTEYQQFTDGRVSGIKHVNEQEYIVTTATIEPGNSGGACVNEAGQVIGINSMKMTNATETNIIIPSNRIRNVLDSLATNDANEKFISNLIKQNMVRNQLAKVFSTKLKADGIEIDDLKVMNTWEKYNLGGFKKVGERITRVSISDWFHKHVANKEGSYSIFKQVMEHIHEDKPEKVIEMRKQGFGSFASDVKIDKSDLLKVTPPRVLHLMRLGVRFNNSTASAVKHYGANGVIVRDVVKRGVFEKLDIRKYDYITKLTIEKTDYLIDNFGESWYKQLNVSLPLKDIIRGQEFGTNVDIHFIRDNKHRVATMCYDFLKHENKPHVRFLETLEDSALTKEVMELPNGLIVKSLRMDDVVSMGLHEYMQEYKQSEYKVVVCEIKPGSEAFQSLNFNVGTVLGKINGEEVKDSWKLVADQLATAFKLEKPFALESDKGRIMFS